LSKRKLPDDYQLLWQTGKRDYEEVIAKAGDLAKTDSLFPFDERMALVYGAADIAIARAGALTLAELLECRIPAVVIPYPFAAGDHQRKNAQVSASAGFVKLLEQDRIHDTDLMDLVVTLTESGQAARMRAAMEQHLAGRQPAVDQIATDIVRLLTEKQNAEAGIDT